MPPLAMAPWDPGTTEEAFPPDALFGQLLVSQKPAQSSSDIPIQPSSVRIHDGPQHDAALLWCVVTCTAMHGRPLVPYQEIAGLPGMIVNEAVLRRVRRQLLDQRPGFFLLHADKAMSVHGVDEQDGSARD